MLSVSPELAAAITAPERTVSVRLSVDWDGDGHGAADSLDDLSGKVTGVDIDRALTTDLPDAVRVVEGSAVASLKADLVKGDNSDDRRHAAWYFSRSNSNSPLAGKERLAREAYCDLVFQTSAGPQSVRRFTGRTRRLPVSAGNRTAQLEALDYRELLRNPVSLIPTGGPTSGADGTWIVAQALHACGFHAGPAPRATGSMFWAPMYGSLLPLREGARDGGATVAGPDATLTYRPAFIPGPFVLAADAYYNSASDYRAPQVQRGTNSVDPTTGLSTWTNDSGRWEQWVKGVTSPTLGPAGSLRHSVGLDVGPPSRLVMGVQHDGKLTLKTVTTVGVTIHGYVSTVTVPSDGLWHAVGIHWDQPAQTVTFKCDAVTQTVATAIAASEIPPIYTAVLANYAPYSDVHLHDIPAATPWLADTLPTPNAVIDPSVLQLEACYDADPREAWVILDEIAGAEQAVSGFDETGIYRYRTRKRLVDTAGQTVQRTLTADREILDLDIDDGVDQVRNIITVTVTPVTVMEKSGSVYSDTQQRTLPLVGTGDRTGLSPNQTAIEVSFPNRVLQLFDVNTSAAPTGNGYVVVTFNSDGTSDGGLAAAQAGAFVDSWTTTTARLVVQNSGTQTMYITAIGLTGIAAIVGTPTPAEARNAASIATFGPQPLPLSASRWVQRIDVGMSLASALLGELKDPHPVITNLGIVGDPRLQLGDRVRIQDLNGAVLDGEYWLTKVADRVSESGGYTQQLAARQATNVMRWGIGRWGIETWG